MAEEQKAAETVAEDIDSTGDMHHHHHHHYHHHGASHHWMPTTGAKSLDFMLIMCVALIIYLIFRHLTLPKNLPPGPRGLPFVGNIIEFLHGAVVPYKLVTEASRIHGSVMTLWFGTTPIVFLNGCDAVDEAFSKHEHDFMDRPELFVAHQLGLSDHGVMFHHYVPRWTAAHNFLSAALCGAGIGLYSLEECIKDELTFLTEQLSEVRGQSIDVCELFNKAAFNIVAVVCVGSRLDYSSNKLRRLLELIAEIRRLPISFAAENEWQLLKYLPRSCVKSTSVEYLKEMIQEDVEQNRSNFNTSKVKCFIDSYLTSAKEHAESHSHEPGAGDTSDEHLVQMIFDLMTGSRSAMTWFAVYVAAHADVQRKMQEEIERVVGHDRRVSLEDRPRMPYTMAVINESLRLGTPTPFSLPHAPIKDSTFRGFHLPKTCTVVANIWSVHHDEKEWPNPEVFNPDRWLDADGQLIQHKAFMPYSVGRRKCVAHWLADAQNFIFLTNILQNFTLGTSSSGVEEPKLLAGSPLREPTSASITVGTRAY